MLCDRWFFVIGCSWKVLLKVCIGFVSFVVVWYEN